jgi:hypothetical protein
MGGSHFVFMIFDKTYLRYFVYTLDAHRMPGMICALEVHDVFEDCGSEKADAAKDGNIPMLLWLHAAQAAAAAKRAEVKRLENRRWAQMRANEFHNLG